MAYKSPIQTGSGAQMSGGTVTVANTYVQTNDVIVVSRTATGGTLGVGPPTITINAGVSFTLTSTNSLETSTFKWAIIKG